MVGLLKTTITPGPDTFFFTLLTFYSKKLRNKIKYFNTLGQTFSNCVCFLML